MKPPKPAKHTVAVDRILDGFKIDAYLANKEGGSLMADELELAHKKAKAELGKLFMEIVRQADDSGEVFRSDGREVLEQRITDTFGKVD